MNAVFLNGLALWALLLALALPAFAEDYAAADAVSAEDDYITCWKQPCIYAAGSEWSEENPNGVAVAVAMGTESIVTDGELKYILTNDFSYYGVSNVRFFFEQNDAPATGVVFHIRGGSDGIYRVTEMRKHVAELAARAKNTNPVFTSSPRE
ncbi:Uncharacterised protein [Halioglobus japonicus]|nr:Uncharacterised protein [Halioglobus japonicus]